MYNIKKLRKDLFLTQAEFAEILEVDRTTVYLWEHRKSEPNFQSLRKLTRLCEDNLINIKDYENC